MFKVIILVALVGVCLIAETTGQYIIFPTYRPPPRRPIIIRTIRNVPNNEPLWLQKGDDVIKAPSTGERPFRPKYIDDIKIDPNRRYACSLDSPSARRGGATVSRTTSNGAAHAGYNRRNVRDVRPSNTPYKPFTPLKPSPYNPNPKPYTRIARDMDFFPL